MAEKFLEIIQLTAIADSVGAPFEMHTRENLLVTLDNGLHKFPRRESPFDVGCQPGQYTDDAQQTIVVARHLIRLEKDGYKPFSFERFMQDCLDVYDEDASENGVPRGGHGGFVNVARFYGDRIGKQREYNSQKQKDIGNGSGMRLNPFMVCHLSGKQLVEYVIGTTLSTHNDVVAVIGNLLMVKILRSLYDDALDTMDVITHSLHWLSGSDLGGTIFPELSTCRDVYDFMLLRMPSFGKFDETVAIYKEYLGKIDKLPDCDNDLRNIDHLIISEEHARPCVKVGGTGLPARARQTIGWFLYLLKNLHTCKSTLDIIRRCILVGGDTDTLAAHVFPISCIVFNRTHNKNEILPEYIMQQLKEININLLKRRIGF
jgi:ADP-ribosylglycohydrolase